MKRITTTIGLTLVAMLLGAPAAFACGFLVSENGAVGLGETTTFVAWENGIERYITSFTFEGPVESFGSLIPLPAEPTDVSRAGDWTLQRLKREVSPPVLRQASLGATEAPAPADVEVILRTQIDSLDVVVLKGGGADVLAWVNENGFALPPRPETTHMLDFYGNRSPYFLAARFDPDIAAEDDFAAGDGIPVMITMPTERPWVPLHILHGATPDSEIITADVFLFTPGRPDLLYGEGLSIERSGQANRLLLDDLRSDDNMEWMPTDAWFTYLRLDTAAENVTYDLSVGVGDTRPSFVDAGFMTIEPSPAHLEAVGLEWVPNEPGSPDVVLTTEQIEALGFRTAEPGSPVPVLTTEQIEALGFKTAPPVGQSEFTPALIAVLAGFLGGALVVAMRRRPVLAGPSDRSSLDGYDHVEQVQRTRVDV